MALWFPTVATWLEWRFAATYMTPDLTEEVQITTNTIDAGRSRLRSGSSTDSFRK
jgi:hypothetical protein